MEKLVNNMATLKYFNQIINPYIGKTTMSDCSSYRRSSSLPTGSGCFNQSLDRFGQIINNDDRFVLYVTDEILCLHTVFIDPTFVDNGQLLFHLSSIFI